MLSNGEYVVNARATSAVGRDFLDALNFGIPSARGSARHRRYAGGGIVEPSVGGRSSGGFDATVHLAEGLVVKHLKSSEGTRTILSAIGNNKNTVRGLLS